MARTPRFKVINADGEYIASCKHAEDAAALASLNGEGTKIRDKWFNILVWHERAEHIAAGESYDTAAHVMFNRISAASDRASARYKDRYGVEL